MTFSLNKEKIKVLMLEWIHDNAVGEFNRAWYFSIDYRKWSLPKEKLAAIIWDYHIICIRSKTNISKDILEKANKLMAIWCFCIWTNQVDLESAKTNWIVVFNAPFSNTRSVAELVIWEIIMLMRWIHEKNILAHQWKWLKSANNSYEIRWKTLWIIWYWHIWSQVSVLAESLWMKVYYYDIVKKLCMGSAIFCPSINDLIKQSDIITLHVPWLPGTENMFWKKEFWLMKKWTFLINASRWNVVDIDALEESLKSWKLLWAAIDVYPKEPKNNDEDFVSNLRKYNNVLLTPHIWWSTLEAQESIWVEVAEKLIKYSDNWSTEWAVNFVELSLAENINSNRVLHIHKNIPGVLGEINEIFASLNSNVLWQYLKTDPDIWYVVIDIEKNKNLDLSQIKNIGKVKWTIKTRILY